jgi:hypothetical protein
MEVKVIDAAVVPSVCVVIGSYVLGIYDFTPYKAKEEY